VLVPSGAGFDGSPTVDWLLNEGYLAKVINNISAEISETLPSKLLKILSLLEDLGCLHVESFYRKKKELEVTVALSIRNVEKYIRACIGSLLAQTTENFEIVIVEDPSFDGWKNIIDAFEDKK
jgi:hypothetical protein